MNSHYLQASHKATSILGASGVELPSSRQPSDSLDRLDLIKLIEDRIHLHRPKVVYAHHAGDVNVDHRRLHKPWLLPRPTQIIT